jgi:long-chain acyl-CoA synthetase
MGLTGSNHLYLSGDPFVMLPRFEPQKVLEAIEKYRIMRMSLVPAMLVALLNYPDAGKYDTSSWQTVVCGSAPLPVSVLQGVQQKFGVTVLEGYGLSEANTAVSGHRLDMKLKPGSVGQPLSGVEVQIVDLDDNALPPNERAEVVVRGPNIMLGYYNNPQATAATIRNGWLHTGDVGYLDEEGYLYIVERKKDLIIRGGQNIYPRDSEEVLAKHPAVREVAVVGIPSEKYGEEVKAYVVRYPGDTVTAEELIEYCQQFLAKYKTPAYIEFIEALPRNPVGKINKRALRELNH